MKCLILFIILDNCKRVAVCFDDVISSCEVINSSSVQVQVSVIVHSLWG